MPRLLNSGMRPHGPRRYSPPPSVALPSVTPMVEDAPAVDANIGSVMEWVKSGPIVARAQAALDTENSKPESNRRKTLVSQLTELILEDETDLI